MAYPQHGITPSDFMDLEGLIEDFVHQEYSFCWSSDHEWELIRKADNAIIAINNNGTWLLQ